MANEGGKCVRNALQLYSPGFTCTCTTTPLALSSRPTMIYPRVRLIAIAMANDFVAYY